MEKVKFEGSNLAQFLEYVEMLEKALELACERIADGPQSYEEANTALGWQNRFMSESKQYYQLPVRAIEHERCPETCIRCKDSDLCR